MKSLIALLPDVTSTMNRLTKSLGSASSQSLIVLSVKSSVVILGDSAVASVSAVGIRAAARAARVAWDRLGDLMIVN